MDRMRTVILTSNPRGNSARIGDHLARSLVDAELVGVIVDLGTAPDRKRQLRRLGAWRRHGGLRYMTWRLWLDASARLRKRPSSAYARSLGEIGAEAGFPVIEVPNVNSEATRSALQDLRADLGVSIGNRIIKRDVFDTPTFGMLNLHHGRIPEYRGGPPAFWEIYHQEPEMGVSVHVVDDSLDHGVVVARGSVPVLPDDDPATLMERAYGIDADLVLRAIEAVARREPVEDRAGGAGGPVHTLPSRREVRALSKRLGRPVRHDDFRRASLMPPP